MSINMLTKQALAQMGNKSESVKSFSPSFSASMFALTFAAIASMVSPKAQAADLAGVIGVLGAGEAIFGQPSYPSDLDPRCVGNVQPIQPAARGAATAAGGYIGREIGDALPVGKGRGHEIFKGLMTVGGAGLARGAVVHPIYEQCNQYLQQHAQNQNNGNYAEMRSSSGSTKCVISHEPGFYSVSEINDSNCKAFISNIKTSPAFKAIDSWSGDGNQTLPQNFRKALQDRKAELESSRAYLDTAANRFASILAERSQAITADAIGAGPGVSTANYLTEVEAYKNAFIQHKKATTNFFYTADRLAADGYAIKPIANQGNPVLDLIKTYPQLDAAVGLTPQTLYNKQVPIGDAVGYNKISDGQSWSILKQVR